LNGLKQDGCHNPSKTGQICPVLEWSVSRDRFKMEKVNKKNIFLIKRSSLVVFLTGQDFEWFKTRWLP
jgi:hypothetical protein